MSSTKISRTAKLAVSQILDDLTDRRGLRQEWDAIDDDIQKEIRDGWARIIDEAIASMNGRVVR